MKLYKFETHDEYLEAQRIVTLRKHEKPTTRFSSENGIMQAIINHHLTPIKFGLCHGVRHGEELDFFTKMEPDAKWIGTEIVEELCDGKRIIQADFADVLDGWLGHFDVIYTNALDHARFPEEAVSAWLSELSPTGKLYVEWHKYHNRIGKRWNKADCYAASAEEYEELFCKCGTVETVLKPSNLGYNRRVFVVT